MVSNRQRRPPQRDRSRENRLAASLFPGVPWGIVRIILQQIQRSLYAYIQLPEVGWWRRLSVFFDICLPVPGPMLFQRERPLRVKHIRLLPFKREGNLSAQLLYTAVLGHGEKAHAQQSHDLRGEQKPYI